MTFLSKATVAFAALSMVAAPVAASAAPAPQFDDLRANTELTNEAAFGPDGAALSAETIILLLAALAAIIAGLVTAADGSTDTSTSPN